MSKRIHKHFDLPVKLHPTEKQHEDRLFLQLFTPPTPRDKAEIERQRVLAKIAPGALIAEYQYRGLAMAHIILNRIEGKLAIDFTSDTLAPASLNTAWDNFARDAEVMRRRLILPLLATENVEDRPSALMLQADASHYFKEAAEEGQHLVTATVERSPTTHAYRRRVAQNVGHAGLLTTCIGLGDQIGYEMGHVSDFHLQDLARRRGLRALERAQDMQRMLGVPPSIAQLADPDSPLSVYWRREAPTTAAIEAYTEAYDVMASVRTQVPTA